MEQQQAGSIIVGSLCASSDGCTIVVCGIRGRCSWVYLVSDILLFAEEQYSELSGTHDKCELSDCHSMPTLTSTLYQLGATAGLTFSIPFISDTVIVSLSAKAFRAFDLILFKTLTMLAGLWRSARQGASATSTRVLKRIGERILWLSSFRSSAFKVLLRWRPMRSVLVRSSSIGHTKVSNVRSQSSKRLLWHYVCFAPSSLPRS